MFAPMTMEGVVHIVPFACAAWLFYILATHLQQSTNKKTYPPGPPGLPLIGNVLSMPNEFDWIRYQELGKAYGLRKLPS